MEEVVFKLNKSIKFDKDGNPGNESFSLVLKSPTYNERKLARKLKQRLTEAMMYVTRQAQTKEEPKKEEPKKEEEAMDGQSILFMLQSVPEKVLDWSEFVDWFSDNCSTVISVDEGVGLTSALIQQMDLDDVDSMVGTYLANFTWNSLMSPSGSQ